MSRILHAVLGVAVVAVAVSAPSVVAAPSAPHARPHVVLSDERVALLRGLLHRPAPTSAAELRARHRSEAAARLKLAGSTGVVAAPGQLALTLPVSAGSKGGQDVLVLTLPDSRPSMLTLRSGRTGAVRWKVALSDAFGLDVARLGPARRLAAVVYETAFTGTGGSDPSGVEDTGQQVNTVRAIDLASGKTDWTSSPLHGTYAANDAGFSETAALYPSGILHDRAGDRVLGVVVTQSFGLPVGAMQQQPVAFDGATGAMTVLGAPAVSDFFVYAEPLGDVTGDGLDDVAQVCMGDDAMVVVTSGAGGPPLWQQAQVGATWVDAFPVPDLNGDRHPDVVTSTDAGTVTAYSGAAGSSLWSRSADAAVPLGVVRGRGAVGVVSFADNLSASGVGGTGATLWQRTIVLPSGGGGGFTSFGVGIGDGGDIDGDHVDDLVADISFDSGPFSSNTTDVIYGRTGKLKAGRAIGDPLYASLDGRGDDFLAVAITAGPTWSLTAYDGSSRHRMWAMRRPVGSQGKPFLMSADVGMLAGHPGRALVLALWDGHATEVMALSARTGHRLWTVNA